MEHECEYCGDKFEKEFQLTMHKTTVHFDTFEERFWDKVDKGDENECWEWKGHKDRGYGGIKYEGKDITASRAYFLGVVGVELSSEVHALHKCDNPSCVNPGHLYLGTHKNNMEDRNNRGGYIRDGEENPNNKLTKKEVKIVKERVNQGDLHRKIAEDFGVSRTTITEISNGNNWGDLE